MRPYWKYPLAVVAIHFALGLLTAPAATATDADEGDKPILDASGRQRHFVLLDGGRLNVMDPRYEEATQIAMASDDPRDPFARHRPPVRAMVRDLEAEYGVRALSMISYIDYGFVAFMTTEIAEAMRSDSRVSSVKAEVQAAKSDFAPTWNDYGSPEVVPWGKQAVGTDDAVTTSNIVYFLDGVAMQDGTMGAHSDVNIIARGTVNTAYECPGNMTAGCRPVPGHATHVAGILGSKANSSGMRGVNPNAPLINAYIGAGNVSYDIIAAMDWSLSDSETRGIFAVANMSLSNPRYSNVLVGGVPGDVNMPMRRLSNRLLVVESAGNKRVSACPNAYGPTKSYDGLLVVGGINNTGNWAAPFNNSPSGYTSEPGTNYSQGCIEVWGPSTDVLSTWNNGTIPYMLLSGTSMAAPHVAALAARYGGTSTRPVERESYIRSKLFATGYTDEVGATIYVPSYTQAASFTVPVRLAPAGATVSSTLAGTAANKMYDGLYLTGLWNAGGGAPAWVEFDLGSSKSVKSMRLVSEVSPSPAAGTHQIYVGPATGGAGSCAGTGMTLVSTITGGQATLEPLSVAFTPTNGRYVRVCTTSLASWVAWREIEIYGN